MTALGVEIFDYFVRTPQEAEAFTEAMSGLTAAVSQEVARVLDTTGVSRAVDIGGAGGALLFALMQANPRLDGTVFELPNVTPSAERAAIATGLQDRVQVVGGDFFSSAPPGDLYLLKYILHDWDDEACVTILRNCRKALLPGGRVAVVELVLGEIGEPGLAPLMDLNMMVMLPGRERTFAEYRVLFKDAGFGEPKFMATNTPMAVIKAAAA